MSGDKKKLRQDPTEGGLAGGMSEAAKLRLRVERARDGDREDQAWLLERYWLRVVRYCLSFEPIGPGDAQDLAQEVCVRALKGLGRLRQANRFEPWLFSIARRRCLTHLGRQKRQRQERERWAAEQTGVAADAGVDRERLEEIQIVIEEIERLPESDQKRAGDLFYRQGMSTSAIAAALDVPVSTVTTWLSRFRGRLRRRLLARLLAHRGHRPEGA